MKEKIVRDFRAATSSAALASFTCACCARELLIGDRIRRQHTEVDLGMLEGPHADSGYPTPPTPFTNGPLEGKLVDPHGVISNDVGQIILELCGSCSRGLHRKSLPKHAIANKLYLGPVPDALSDLTMVEECMIA